MIQLSNLSLPVGSGEEELKSKAAKLLGISPSSLSAFAIVKQSIDARKKQDLRLVYTVRCALPDEASALASGVATPATPLVYQFPHPQRTSPLPPVVVGMGPAGLFAALFLARAGLRPILLERGRPVEERTADVAKFWLKGQLDTASNVQFGEGGAGTFSDGKLQSGIHDPRAAVVLQTLVAHGAPPDILYSHKPHIGTDLLRQVVKSLREELMGLGCDIRFQHQLIGMTSSLGVLNGLTIMTPTGPYSLPCDCLVLAPGHSARDTFSMLHQAGVPMEAKSFAVGLRIEHRQQDISLAQYGPQWEQLPPSDYKLACHLPDGRGVFTFCVCPGGQVVAAASGAGQVVTNGMSHRARDGVNINGGVLVGVNPSDFEGSSPLAGVQFQAQWEGAAAGLSGGTFHAPCQTVGTFLSGTAPALSPLVTPTYRPGVTAAPLAQCLPPVVTQSIQGALPLFDRKLRGFAHPDALLTGVETRSSSPVRLLRGTDCQSPLRGLYPCGEGGGWAGGITSAATDGIRVAEQVALG